MRPPLRIISFLLAANWLLICAPSRAAEPEQPAPAKDKGDGVAQAQAQAQPQQGRRLDSDPDVKAAKDRLDTLLSSASVKGGQTGQALADLIDKLDKTSLKKLDVQDRGALKGMIDSAVSGENPDMSKVLDDRLKQALERQDGKLKPGEKEVLKIVNKLLKGQDGKGEGAAPELKGLMETVKALNEKSGGGPSGGGGSAGGGKAPPSISGLEGLKEAVPDKPAPTGGGGGSSSIVDRGRGLFDNGRVATIPGDDPKEGIVFVAQGPSHTAEEVQTAETGTRKPPMNLTTDIQKMIESPPPRPEPKKAEEGPVEAMTGWVKDLAAKPKDPKTEERPFARSGSLPQRSPDGALAARKVETPVEEPPPARPKLEPMPPAVPLTEQRDLRDAPAALPELKPLPPIEAAAAPAGERKTTRSFDNHGRLARETVIQPDGSFESRAWRQYPFKGIPLAGHTRDRDGALDVIERGVTMGSSLKITQALVMADGKATRHEVLKNRAGDMLIRVDMDPATGRPQDLRALVKAGYLSKYEADRLGAFEAPARSGGWLLPPTLSFRDGRPVLEAERRAPGGGVERYLSTDSEDGWVVSRREPLKGGGHKERVEVWEGWTADTDAGYGPAAMTVYERSVPSGKGAKPVETSKYFARTTEGELVEAEEKPEPASKGGCKKGCRGKNSKGGIGSGVYGAMPSVVSIGGPASPDDEEEPDERPARRPSGTDEPELRSGVGSGPVADPEGHSLTD